MDIWAFRSVLDERARMLTLALHKDLWVAYDATNCGLYRAWSGGVKFDGAVYTTVHGPQPTSMGDVHVAGLLDQSVWRITSDDFILTVRPEFKGYRIQNGEITLQYRFPFDGREIWVFEKPEAVTLPDGRISFDRTFTTRGAKPTDVIRLSTLLGADAVVDGDGAHINVASSKEVGGKVFRTATLTLGKGVTKLSTRISLSDRPGVGEDLFASLGDSAPEPPAQQDQPREPGVAMRVYFIGQEMSKIPELLLGQSPNRSVVIPNIDLNGYQAFGEDKDQFYVKLTGFLNIEKAGDYTFKLTSDDGSRFMIRDEVIVDHDGLHGDTPKEGSFRLSPGEHPFEIDYFESGGGEVLRLEWKTPGSEEFVVVPPSVFTTPKGEVRVTAPGKKNIFDPAKRWRPGDGIPLAGVHPSLDLETVRPKNFQPRVGGIDFLADGRMVICTWDADGAVYVLEGVQADKPHDIKVKRIAAGLAEPLGIKVVDGEIYVLQKQELTRLRDLDKDGVMDEYYAVANGWGVTANFHEFAFGLVYQKGFFYATLAVAIDPGGSSSQAQNPDRGSVVKISKDGGYQLVARGLRTPNGIGFGAGGRIYIADNQGDWLPSSKILPLKEGVFYGSRAVRKIEDRDTPECPPVVWLPQGEIGNSPSQIAALNHGPYKGQMVHGDVTHGGLKRVFVEEVNGILQGVVFRYTQGLEAGINRVIVGPDGAFYVGGIGSTGNWGQEGKERFGLQRLRYNGKPVFEPLAVRAFSNGMEIELTKPLMSTMGNAPGDYHIDQWRYVPTATYGGPKVDFQSLRAKSVTVSKDRRKVFLEIDGMKPGHVVYFKLGRGLASVDNDLLWTTEAWYTLNQIPAKAHLVAPAVQPVNELTAEERAQGYKLLFDGKTAENFRGFKKTTLPPAWQVVDSELVLIPGATGTGGDIVTKESYSDFELRFEWKIWKGGNSGVFYRVDEAVGAWSTGPEYQLLDDDLHPDGRKPETSAASNYAMMAPSRDVARPVMEWNESRIIVRGDDVEHWLNGYKVVSYRLGSPEWQALKEKSKFASLPQYGTIKTGPIVLQDHGNRVAFRNLRIKRL